MQFKRFVRRHERAILVTLAVLLAVSFRAGAGFFGGVVAGVARLLGLGGDSTPKVVARIFGEPVLQEEFADFWHRWGPFPFAAENFEEGWSAFAALQLARRVGIRVSDAEIDAFVRLTPAFLDEPTSPQGRFSYARYKQIVELYGFRGSLGQQRFEETLREYLSVLKLRELLFEVSLVTSAEVWPSYRDVNMSYRTASVRFAIERFLPEVAEPGDEELSTFYEAEKERRYREPERIQVEVLAAHYTGLLEQVEVSEEEARTYYDAHPREFTAASSPEGGGVEDAEAGGSPRPFDEVRGDILDRLRGEEARKLAHAALADARREALANPETTLASLAEASDGKLRASTTDFFSPQDAAEVAEVPFLGSSFEPHDRFLSSLLALDEGKQELSEVTEGEEAAVLCRLLARRPSEVLALEEVRERAVEDLKRSRALDRARQAAEKLVEELTGQTLSLTSEEVKQRDLEVVESSWYRWTDPEAPVFARRLRGREAGVPFVAQAEDANFVVEVLETRPPDRAEFEEARGREKRLAEMLNRRWILPARWESIVRRETGLEVFGQGEEEEVPEEEADEGATSPRPATGGEGEVADQPGETEAESEPTSGTP